MKWCDDPVYIEMCKKAELEHSPEAGDYYFNETIGEVVILPMEKHIQDFCSYECLYLVGAEDYWWLPRQDQLQEMIWRPKGAYITYQKPLSLLGWIYDFAYHRDNHTQRREIQHFLNNANASMEQLWLAFAQHELHQKVWDSVKKEWMKA